MRKNLDPLYFSALLKKICGQILLNRHTIVGNKYTIAGDAENRDALEYRVKSVWESLVRSKIVRFIYLAQVLLG